MKVKQLREYTDALQRFAVARETSIGPQTIIGVQVSDAGALKLISGTTTAGMVVRVEDFTPVKQGSWGFTIAARPLLQAVKVLPARSDVELHVMEDRLVIKAAAGGAITLPKNGDLRTAGFPKKPKEFSARGKIEGKTWKQVAKLFKNVVAKLEIPSVQVVDGTGYATAIAPGNHSSYASVRFDAEGPPSYNMSAYRDFWEAWTPFTEDGTLMWGIDGVLAKSGIYECYSAPWLVSKYDPKTGLSGPVKENTGWPIMVSPAVHEVSLTIPKKDLLAIVKGQAPFDEHNRVTLEVDTDLLRVTPFGTEEGQEIPCVTSGKGIRSVSAGYLSGLLSSMDAKEVTLGWSRHQPAITLSAGEYDNWTILLAPTVK